MSNSTKTYLKQFCLTVAGYILAATVSQVLFHTIYVWPATGIAFAAVCLFGYRIWPAVFVGSALSVVQYTIIHQLGLATTAMVLLTLLTAVSNTLAILAGVWLAQKFLGRPITFSTPKDVLLFVFFGAGVTAVLAAEVGVGIRFQHSLPTAGHYSNDLVHWLVADFIGVIIFAPPFILSPKEQASSFVKFRLDYLLVILAILSINLFVFGPMYDYIGPQLGQPILVILPLLWAAIVFPLHTATIFSTLSFLLMWWGISSGYGVFSNFEGSTAGTAAQTFMAVIVISILVVSTIVSQNRAVASELSEHDDRLRLALITANIGVWTLDLLTQKISTRHWLEHLGYQPEDIANNFNTWAELLHPDDREQALDYF